MDGFCCSSRYSETGLCYLENEQTKQFHCSWDIADTDKKRNAKSARVKTQIP